MGKTDRVSEGWDKNKRNGGKQISASDVAMDIEEEGKEEKGTERMTAIAAAAAAAGDDAEVTAVVTDRSPVLFLPSLLQHILLLPSQRASNID